MSKSAPAASSQETAAWSADTTVKLPDGRRLPRYGLVADAARMLCLSQKKQVYELIHAGLIRAFKASPNKPNSPYRVDLLSVWKLRQRQLEGE